VPENPDATAVLEAIVRLAVTIDCDVVVEGIETAAQRDAVLAMGGRLGQGYGLGRPVPAGEATALLLEHLLPSRRRDTGQAVAQSN